MRPERFKTFEHGGSVNLGKRKRARPLDPKRPLHLVFRSSRARGAWSFLHRRHKGLIHLLLIDCAERFDIKIYRYENVGNHIHLIAKGRTRASIRAFLRVFPQRLMFQVTGARRGNPQGRFFDRIAYSRVVEWGKEFTILQRYLWKNAMQALGWNRRNLWIWRGLEAPP